MASTELTPTEKVVANIENPAYLEQLREHLPENVSLQRFVAVAKTAVRSNPDLVGADQGSLFGSLIKCAQDGLYPDGREAALVIYSGKVSYLPMIGGYRKIAADHGWTIITQTVRDGDEFDYEEGLEPKLVHRRARPGDRGDLVNAYAIATHRDGRKLFVVLDDAEVEKCRQVSKSKDKSGAPWTTWTERMWEKTAGKRLFRQLPISDRELVDRVVAADFIPEGSSAAELLYGTDGAAFTATELPAGPPADEPMTAERESQQAPAPEPLSPGAGAPGDTDQEQIQDGVFEPIEDEAPAVTAEELAAAGTIKVTSGAWKDRTLDEIAEAGSEGADWLLVQIKKATYGSAKWQPLATVIRGRLPETWAIYEQWREAQS